MIRRAEPPHKRSSDGVLENLVQRDEGPARAAALEPHGVIGLDARPVVVTLGLPLPDRTACFFSLERAPKDPRAFGLPARSGRRRKQSEEVDSELPVVYGGGEPKPVSRVCLSLVDSAELERPLTATVELVHLPPGEAAFVCCLAGAPYQVERIVGTPPPPGDLAEQAERHRLCRLRAHAAVDVPALVDQSARAGNVAGLVVQVDRLSDEQLRDHELVAKRPEEFEALPRQLGSTVEVAGHVDRAAEHANRSSADELGEVDRPIEKCLDTPCAVMRRGGRPELLERDCETQTELDLADLSRPVEGCAEIVLLG